MTDSRYHLTQDEFHALTRNLSNWGKWGADDEAGTLHYITPEARKRGAATVRDGIAVSCALNVPTVPAVDTPRPTRLVVYRGDDPNMGAAGDFMTLEPHGWSMTHLDALSHIYYEGKLYNDRPIDAIAGAGVKAHSIMTAGDGIVSRGILIDLPRALGKDFMDPGEAASGATVKKALADANLTVEPGDVLLFRTGRYGRNKVHGTPPNTAGLAGVSVEAAEWIHDWQVSSLICDGGMDTQPSEVDGIRIPWHILTLNSMGMLITDNADLEAVAEMCARLNRWEFQLILAPLKIPGSTSSPVNPIAVF